MAPNIFNVTIVCLTNSLAGFAEMVKKFAAKGKADSSRSIIMRFYS